ncbi:MAG: universal stress protein [Dehalococcoidales bacterium]|nr:universal stress protein [Dehalococcoidales bacterium]
MYKKILVCLDGSEMAEQILPFAVEQALHFNGKLVLFKTFSEPGFVGLAVPGFPGVRLETGDLEKQLKMEEEESRKYLDSVAQGLLAQRGLKADCAAIMGVAGETIVKYAADNDIDLVALATHGRTGPGRVILGSVADHVIRHARVPILLIRPVEMKKKA